MLDSLQFDQFGMPDGELGVSFYGRVMRDLADPSFALHGMSPSGVFEFITPLGTAAMLDNAEDVSSVGADLSDGQGDSVMLNIAFRPVDLPHVADLWGQERERQVGALAHVQYASGNTGDVTSVVLISRSGTRARAQRDASGAVVVDVVLPQGAPMEVSTGFLPLLARAMNCAIPEAELASGVSVRDFATALACASATVLSAEAQRVLTDKTELDVGLFTIGCLAAFRAGIALAGGQDQPRAAAMHSIVTALHQGGSPDLTIDTTLAAAITQCRATINSPWAAVLQHHTSRALLRDVLPARVLDDSDWGGQRLLEVLIDLLLPEYTDLVDNLRVGPPLPPQTQAFLRLCGIEL